MKTKLHFRYRIINIAFMSILCMCLSASAASSPFDSAKTCLTNQNYQKAETILKRICLQHPDDINAAYLVCAVRQTKILDYESYTIEKDDFSQCADATLRTLNRLLPLQHGLDSLHCLFYIGSVFGGVSVMAAKVGNWPSAIQSGLRSVDYFSDVLKADSSFYPAYFGVGVFDYYTSRNLGWMPFVRDKSEESIERIRRATKADAPYSFAAWNSLCWILCERKQYNAADSAVTALLKIYPENTLFIRLKARIAYYKCDWHTAIVWAQKLAEISEKRAVVNWSDYLSGCQILSVAYDALGMENECNAICKKALALTIPDPAAKISYVKKHLKSIAEMQKKICKK